MKYLIISLLIVFCCGLARADDLALLDGTVYKNVMLISADPDRMLIVHDGGGCQVAFKELGPGALSSRLQDEVAEGIRRSTERKVRLEKLQVEKQAFELAQREKGLVLFEENWMTPSERQDLLTRREEHKLALEKMRLELEKEKLELRKQQLLADQEKRMLDQDRRSYLFYNGNPWQSSGSWNSRWGAGCRNSSGVNVSLYNSRGYLMYNTGRSHHSSGRAYGLQR